MALNRRDHVRLIILILLLIGFCVVLAVSTRSFGTRRGTFEDNAVIDRRMQINEMQKK